MSEQKQDAKPEVNGNELSLSRLIVGQLISWIVAFAAIYPMFSYAFSDQKAEVIYSSDKLFFLTTGAFLLQFAYMAGFRAKTHRLINISNYIYTAVITANMAVSVYCYAVMKHNVASWVYWVGIVVVLLSTVVPVAISDLVKSKKQAQPPAAE